MNTMSITEKTDLMTQIVERDAQEHYDKFKQETFELACKRRAVKERKEKEAGTPVESAVSEK